ncbi:phage tail protein [Photorhabdus aegyptia]|uniref:Phage protein U n=1 Tax=Photorhabdus aegyptia TaxID=2805098 RepID=A0A022PJH1_9GAMM|nr:phage tail protein [Photorhabdus aegyptia]EYU14655.1 phage protein U [Photorhabdus aegyptia]
MMAALGLFVFMLKTTPYQSLQHQQSWRYGFNNRVGARPAFQFMGPNNDTITLSGALYPEITGGMFIIASIDQTKSEFFTDGTARKIDFTVTVRRVDDNLGEMFGDLRTQMTDLKTRVTHKLGGLFS